MRPETWNLVTLTLHCQLSLCDVMKCILDLLKKCLAFLDNFLQPGSSSSVLFIQPSQACNLQTGKNVKLCFQVMPLVKARNLKFRS